MRAERNRAEALLYHWWELPEVSFWPRQKYATNICCDKHAFVTTNVYITFVATNICRDKRFVSTTIFWRDKHTFVATSMLLSRQNMSFVATKTCLSRQFVCFCRNKNYTCGRNDTSAYQPNASTLGQTGSQSGTARFLTLFTTPSTEAHRKLFIWVIFYRWSLGPERSQSGWPGFSNVRIARRRLIVN